MLNKLSRIVLKIVMVMMAQVTPSCNSITQKISESMDYEISIYNRLMIKIHLMGCVLCTRFRDQLLVLHDLIDGYEQQKIEKDPAELKPEARIRIKQSLKDLNNQEL